MLKTRLITALIGIVVLAIAISYGGFIFNLMMSILAFIGWVEFGSLCRHMKVKVLPIWGLIYVVLVCGSKVSIQSICATVSGILYVTSGFVALMAIRDTQIYKNTTYYAGQSSFGESVIWVLLLSIWASDTFAYFVGKKWGSRRIVPDISPNKTLEGFIGGFIGCVLTGWIGSICLGLPTTIGTGIGIIVGIMAPLGDLFESKLKRLANKKDSGSVLPGHGGVLDRFDSVLFATPLVLAYILML